jgi:signal peptidase II
MRSRLVLAFITLSVVALHLLTKALGIALLEGAPRPLGFVTLRAVYNSGVAFGLGADAPAWLVLTLTTLISAAVAVAAWRGTLDYLPSGLILGGAVGNLLDRAGDGIVTDLIDLRWWPTFNLADACITIGAVLLLVRQRSPTDTSESPASAAQ